MMAAAFMGLLVVVVLVARFKKIPLPFAPPRLPLILKWMAIFLVFAVIQELTGSYLGGGSAPQWEAMTPARLLRALTIVLLAPLAEEVALRGTMYGNLEKRGLHPAVTVLAPAVVFALIHFQYSGLGLAYIFVDGVIFGLARRDTKSIFVPILLHSLGNAYAVWERIF